ncbi:hypothetical protein GQ473_04710 [archaeon]|nr:hypothetical protein [archaeon]
MAIHFIDINNTARNAEYLKIITCSRSDNSTIVKYDNVDGELIEVNVEQIAETEESFVEAEIIGRNNNWIEWYPLEQFEKLNPTIEL